ncbi:MAG TPA: YsnF/AvaK domain-containing protein [Chloroflexota bacterium]
MGMVELHIRAGAPVECVDGPAGKVGRLETDRDGNLSAMHIETERGEFVVPEGAVADVRADGTVRLDCALADMRPLAAAAAAPEAAAGPVETLSLREEQLVAHKTMEQVGEVVVRTEVEELPGRLEVEALREEVQVEHVPLGQVVSQRREPWEEDGVLIVPVYEEQLVVTKRLVLREEIRLRRVRTAERQLFEETLRRERAIVEDPGQTGLVRELRPTEPPVDSQPVERPLLDSAPGSVVDPLLPTPEEIRRATEGGDPARPHQSFVDRVVRKALD